MKNEEQSSIEQQNHRGDPIVVLKFKKWLFAYVMLSILWGLWFASFRAIVPYLTTGDFVDIWPVHHGSTITKVGLFAMSCFFLLFSPFLVPCFRVGDIAFYETPVEIKPFLGFFKKRIVSYGGMHVVERGDRGFILTKNRVPDWRANMFNYWKAMNWEGIIVSRNSMGLNNPECLARALEIIRERAITITKL